MLIREVLGGRKSVDQHRIMDPRSSRFKAYEWPKVAILQMSSRKRTEKKALSFSLTDQLNKAGESQNQIVYVS